MTNLLLVAKQSHGVATHPAQPQTYALVGTPSTEYQ